jgi:diacylglycerol O-acyltransferase
VRAYAGLKLPELHPVVHNLVISNVPGPPVPLYFMGALIEALYPLGPVFHGAGLNVTVMSNNGRVNVGIIACRESMPDVEDLVRRFPAELARLKAAVAEIGKPTPVRPTTAKKKPAKKTAAKKTAAKKPAAKKRTAAKKPARAGAGAGSRGAAR